LSGGDEQADGDTGLPEEAFEAGLWRGVSTVFFRLLDGLVEVGPPGKFFHKDQVLRLAFASTDDPRRPQGFAVLGKAGGKIVGWSGEVGLAPSPEFLGEGREVFQAQVAVEVRDSVATKNFLLNANIVAENRLRVLQCVRGDNEAFRLHEPNPELVVLDNGVGCHNGLSGDRPEVDDADRLDAMRLHFVGFQDSRGFLVQFAADCREPLVPVFALFFHLLQFHFVEAER